MTQMSARNVATPAMASRQSTDVIVNHTTYDAINVEFDQNQFTYEYSSFRGEIQPRTISTVQMKGR